MTEAYGHSVSEFAPPPVLRIVQRRSLVIGLAATAIFGIGGVFQPQQFFRSYLIAYMLWLGVALGSLALLMLQHLSGGYWGVTIRRPLEAAIRTLPWVALGFLPIALGLKQLYPWSHMMLSQLGSKGRYLLSPNAESHAPYFWVLSALCFAGWLVLMQGMLVLSDRQDSDPSIFIRRRLQYLSGPGLVFYGLSITLVSVVWVMSLYPDWGSTIYGMLFMAGEALASLCIMIGTVILLARYEPMSRILRRDVLQDLGKLVLTFVMLWAYFGFSQWVIIWAGNLPEETSFYLFRLRGGWEDVGILLIVLHFFTPFFLLLSRELKRRAGPMAIIVGGLLVMRWLDMVWWVEPSFKEHRAHFGLPWMDVVAPFAMGGIWLALYFGNLRKRPLLPVNDPQIVSMLEEGHARV